MTHRGSGRGPNAVEIASHLSAADLAAAVAFRRDRLVARQRVPYQADPRRQDEINTLGDIHRMLIAFELRRLPLPALTAEQETHERLLFEDRERRKLTKGRDMGT